MIRFACVALAAVFVASIATPVPVRAQSAVDPSYANKFDPLYQVLQRHVSVNPGAMDVYDFVAELGRQAQIPIALDASIKHAAVGLPPMQDQPLEVVLEALCARFGWVGATDGPVLMLGPAKEMSQRFGGSTLAFGIESKTVVLRNALADDVRAQLLAALPPGTVVLSQKRGAITIKGTPEAVRSAMEMLTQLDRDEVNKTVIIPVRYRRPSDIVKAIQPQLPDGVKGVVADDDAHRIVVAAQPGVSELVRSLVASIDTEQRQVYLEVTVYDYTPLNETSNLGVSPGGFSGGNLTPGQITFTKGSPVAIGAQLNALSSNGKSWVVAKPSSQGIENRAQTINVGDTLYVIGSTITNGTVTQQVIPIQTGVITTITPQQIHDGEVTLVINVQNSTITGYQNNNPIVSTQQAQETYRIHDGDTVMIGGLMQDTDNDTITKIPGLGDLPILGVFFRDRQRTRSHSSLAFVIRAVVQPLTTAEVP